MRIRALSVLTRKEMADALRNRWLQLFAVSFAVLALAFSSAALLGSGRFGFAGFGRTAASLINLVLLVVPVMGLTTGAQALVGEKERGTLAYLLAQPVSRLEVFASKFLGQALALSAALLLGFGFSAAVLAAQGGGAEVGVLGWLLLLGIMLATVSLAVGYLISAWASASSAALGTAVFLWLALAFGCDMVLMGAAAMAGWDVRTLFEISLANPLSVFRMAAVLAMRSSLEILGPAGMYAAERYGAMLQPLFLATLAAWTAAPLVAAYARFHGRDAV